MESQPKNPEFRNNPENFHPCNNKKDTKHNIDKGYQALYRIAEPNHHASRYSLCNKDHLGIDARKPVFRFANNKGAGQPAHPCSLISAFVIRFLESIISILAIKSGEISIV